MINIYVGNLAREVTQQDLEETFKPFGEVLKTAVIKDKYTGEHRGFGFVEMSSNEAGKAAITALNGKDLKGKVLSVNEARPKNDDRGSGRGHVGSFKGGNRKSRGNHRGFERW